MCTRKHTRAHTNTNVHKHTQTHTALAVAALPSHLHVFTPPHTSALTPSPPPPPPAPLSAPRLHGNRARYSESIISASTPDGDHSLGKHLSGRRASQSPERSKVTWHLNREELQTEGGREGGRGGREGGEGAGLQPINFRGKGTGRVHIAGRLSRVGRLPQ